MGEGTGEGCGGPTHDPIYNMALIIMISVDYERGTIQESKAMQKSCMNLVCLQQFCHLCLHL